MAEKIECDGCGEIADRGGDIRRMTDDERRESMIAGWNACRKSLYAVCEDVQENDAKRLGGHWGAGMAQAAKSIARGFGAMNAEDDDNLLAAIAAHAE